LDVVERVDSPFDFAHFFLKAFDLFEVLANPPAFFQAADKGHVVRDFERDLFPFFDEHGFVHFTLIVSQLKLGGFPPDGQLLKCFLQSGFSLGF
jgi:hypothetical protein